MSGGFKGFQRTGGISATIKNTNMFNGFLDTSYGQVGSIGGIPSTGLVAWFNPSVNVTLGTGVSQWQDISGAYTLSQATVGSQPAYITGNAAYNYRPYLSFNGTSSIMNGGNILSIGTQSQLQAIIVVEYNSVSGITLPLISDYNNTLGGRYIPVYTNGGFWTSVFTDTANRTPTNGTIAADTNLHLHSIEVDRGAGLCYYSLDGTWHKGNAVCNTGTTNYPTSNFSLGAFTASLFINAYIFDIFIYNQNLSQTDYLMLRNYIGSLYNF
jgi:hypothetical protein